MFMCAFNAVTHFVWLQLSCIQCSSTGFKSNVKEKKIFSKIQTRMHTTWKHDWEGETEDVSVFRSCMSGIYGQSCPTVLVHNKKNLYVLKHSQSCHLKETGSKSPKTLNLVQWALFFESFCLMLMFFLRKRAAWKHIDEWQKDPYNLCPTHTQGSLLSAIKNIDTGQVR